MQSQRCFYCNTNQIQGQMLKDAYHNTCLDYWAHNNNNNNNNNIIIIIIIIIITVHPPSGSSPVKNYKLYKKWKTIIYYKKNWIEIYNIKSKNIGL